MEGREAKAVASTSTSPLSSSLSTETSKVPAPRSNTTTVPVEPPSPYASDAATGSERMLTSCSPASVAAIFVASRCSLLKYAGTVTTARATGSPTKRSASRSSSSSSSAPTASGASGPGAAGQRKTTPHSSAPTSNAARAASMRTPDSCLPMNRLAPMMVFLGLAAACSSASCPTSTPSAVYATTDGVVVSPCRLGTMSGLPSRSTAMAEFVVPRSMPTVHPTVMAAHERTRTLASKNTTRVAIIMAP
eukprot:scaffold113891_cov69-Phaeocystis_antarctica.AAC.4